MKKFLHSTVFTIYVCAFLFSIQLALTSYVNSSFVGSFVSDAYTGLVYMIASIIGIAGVFAIPRLLARFGLYRFISALAVTSALIGLCLTHTGHPARAVTLFIIWFLSNSFMVVAFDILLEDFSKNATTGHTRGLYLTISNFGWIISAFISGTLLDSFGYTGVYTLGALFMLSVSAIILLKFRKFRDPAYPKIAMRGSLREVLRTGSIRNVFAANFLLQFFYVMMVIYMPLYLHAHLGYAWSTIGAIFTVMLLPFVIFEYPLGKLADRIGEQTIMASGFVILAAATITAGSVGHANAFIWALVLFMSRVGASAVEVMTESYFFKKISGGDAGVISLFRTLAPSAYIITPVITFVLLSFFPFESLFIMTGIVMLLGISAALALRKTNHI